MLPEERIPQAIGRYQVLKVLGTGAMGHVLLAEDPKIKRKVAIKVVRMEALRAKKDLEEYLGRFQREAEISGLLNHPGIVTIYDVGEEEGIGPFMAMEFVGGQTIEALTKSNLPISLDRKILISKALAEALDHAHQLGVVHRDVKPGNVMLTEDGRPKLMDFGIAKREDAGLTQTGTFLGTPSYAAPEQIKEGHVTPRSDQFSFAVMVFELLSGKLPFPGSSINTILYRIVNEPPSDPRPPVEGILPDAWHRIFLKALSKDPAERFATCTLFVQALAEATVGGEDAEEADQEGPSPEALPPVIAPPNLPPITTHPLGAETRIAPILQLGPSPEREETPALDAPSKRSFWPWVALLLVAGGAGGFVLWGRRGGTTVLLKTTPDKAMVTLNGRSLSEPTPLQQVLHPGDHLRFEAKGFQPKEADFTQGSQWPARFSLDPIISAVELQSVPAGAHVVMDGKPLDGVTPLSVTWNQGQPHQLTFTKDSSSLPGDFAVGEVPAGPFILPSPATSNAAVTGNGTAKITGAFPVRVRVDGQDQGELSAGHSLDLAPGDHRIEWSNPKFFFSETRSFTVTMGKETRLALPALATLSVSTHPGVGDVLVDGRPTGIQSDGSSIRLAAGRHQITIRSLGGKVATQSVDVQGDKSINLPL